jgi:DNA-binding response OmpR family regulator
VHASVLVVETQGAIRNLLRAYLERDGITVTTAGTGAQALQLAARHHPDLVLLDLDLPDIPGEEVAQALTRIRRIPIVLLAGPASADRLQHLHVSDEDYIAKPFSQCEIVHRVNTVLGRTHSFIPAPRSFAQGRLVIDDAGRTVSVAGRTVSLTPTEWDLLTAMADCPGRVFTRSTLISRLCPDESPASCERAVDGHVRRLRRKLACDPSQPPLIQTVIGAGYRLAARCDRQAGTAAGLVSGDMAVLV